MKQEFSSQQLALLDTHPQRVEFYAAFHKPRIIAHGTLSAIPNNYPGSQVLIKNLTNGLNLTDIQAGMTLRIGSESQKDDYGTLRVRENYASGSIIKTAMFGSGLVNFITGACLTVMEDYRVWPIHHDYDTALSTWLVDTQNYTSQLSLYGPQAIMGPPAVATLDGGKAVIPYVGNLSYSHSAGASIASQAWAFPNGQAVSSALGSSAAPVNITYIDASPTGRYHSLTVTDGNGTSHIGKRLTFAFSSHIDQQPARVSFESITGGLKAGGYRTRVTVLDNAPSGLVNDGGLVVIFERASYGTAGSSVGGNYHGRENIVLVGRVVGESLRIEPFTNQLSFALETIDGTLRRTNAYDLFLEGSSAASSWDMASNLTLDHAALALVKHRSTISTVTDFHPASGAAATNEIYYRSLPAGTLWDQLTYNYQAAFGIVAADMQGVIWAGLDAQVTGLSANLPNVMAITKDRRMDSTTIEHDHHDANAQYRLYAIQGGTALPLGAESPGQRQGYYGGKQEVTRNLLTTDQDTLITWSGNVRARENNPYKRVITGLRGNFRLDSVPQSRVTMSLSATDAKRRVDWINKVFIPAETTLNYDNAGMFATAEVTLEASVNGMGGSAITFPTVTSTPPVSTPPTEPPPNPSTGDQNLVYVATYTRLGRSRNFLSDYPLWENVTGSISGNIIDFLLDPYDPVNSAYALSDTAVYKTGNLNATSPTWTSKITLAAIRTELGDSTVSFRNISTSIANNGTVWVSLFGDAGAGSSGDIYVVHTADHFSSHSATLVATAVDGQPHAPDIHVQGSNRSAGMAYVVGIANALVGKLYVTTNSNASWSVRYNFGVALEGFEAAYAGSTDTAEMIFYVNRSPDFNLYRSTDGGLTFTQVLAPSGTPGAAPRPSRIVNVATHLSSDVIYAATGEGIYDSSDGGNSWHVNSLTGTTKAIGRWPYNPDHIYLFIDDRVKYSDNRGNTFSDKVGNWASAMGTAFALGTNVIPVWVAG